MFLSPSTGTRGRHGSWLQERGWPKTARGPRRARRCRPTGSSPAPLPRAAPRPRTPSPAGAGASAQRRHPARASPARDRSGVEHDPHGEDCRGGAVARRYCPAHAHIGLRTPSSRRTPRPRGRSWRTARARPPVRTPGGAGRGVFRARTLCRLMSGTAIRRHDPRRVAIPSRLACGAPAGFVTPWAYGGTTWDIVGCLLPSRRRPRRTTSPGLFHGPWSVAAHHSQSPPCTTSSPLTAMGTQRPRSLRRWR